MIIKSNIFFFLRYLYIKLQNVNNFESFNCDVVFQYLGRTMAEHMLAMPWSEELLARSIEKSLYHGKHMTFCRKKDDKLALVNKSTLLCLKHKTNFSR